jgi:dynein heavy chain 2
MIICQRPMMLASALELSRLVQEEEVVSWEDTKSVEKYVETLKNAVEKLSKENNLLASYYYQIMDKVRCLCGLITVLIVIFRSSFWKMLI